ncbi:MAG TPA: thioesterase family protein [Acidimicrobiia bacterium]|jgi:acyl-CoA thioesterase-2|nr:thioesterase family protein [Acidimicrobiia bacterium]
MGDLAADTAIEGSDGRYQAQLSRDWEIWGPNGGYLAVIALRAAGARTPLRRPATFSCHFLGVADFDVVDLDVRVVRESRRAASIAVSMTQSGKPILEALAWIVGDVDGLEHDAAPIPTVAPPDELPNIEQLMASQDRGPYHLFWSNFEQRPLEWVKNWEEREPGDPSFRSWYRYAPRDTFDDPFVDAGRSLLLADTVGWPAAVRAYRSNLSYYAPSIDVTVRFHACPPHSPWLLVEGRSPVARDGLVASTVSVWSGDGALLASGGQQMLCRPAVLLDA